MYAVGIDIGGTKIKLGLFDGNDQLYRHTEIPTPKEDIIGRLVQEITDLVGGKQITGIGVASAGIVDFDRGIITCATNLPSLENHPLKDILENQFGVPVLVDNDANCAAFTEGILGIAKDVNNYVCITIGTGIGGGVVQHNKIIHGLNSHSGEVGHMMLIPDGILCDCGKRGCWEKYASGRALEQAIHKQPLLTERHYSPRDLFNNYPYDPQCREIIDTFIHYLSIGIINIQYMMDPEMIVLGGGIVNAGGPWWKELLHKVSINSPIKLNLKKAAWKNDASMIGAALQVKKLAS